MMLVLPKCPVLLVRLHIALAGAIALFGSALQLVSINATVRDTSEVQLDFRIHLLCYSLAVIQASLGLIALLHEKVGDTL